MIIKQILFIAQPSKADSLAKQLYFFSEQTTALSSCLRCEVYSCDDDSNEFMMLVQFGNHEGYQSFENNQLVLFEKNNQSVILKKEILRLD